MPLYVTYGCLPVTVHKCTWTTSNWSNVFFTFNKQHLRVTFKSLTVSLFSIVKSS